MDDTSILLASVGNAQDANLYAYCNNNPVNWVDYSGQFKQDYHLKGTLAIALNFFKVDYAKQMAQGSNDVDEKYAATRQFYSQYSQSFHFNINSDNPYMEDSRLTRAREMTAIAWAYVANALIYKNILTTLRRTTPGQSLPQFSNTYYAGILREYKSNMMMAMYYFGMALHPIQDSIAHSGPGGNVKVGRGRASFYMHINTSYDDKNGIYLPMGCKKSDMFTLVTVFACIAIQQNLVKMGIYF